jgi:HEAT repeat protein
MSYTTIDQAIEVLNDSSKDYREREDAVHFLCEHPSQQAIDHLVRALQDNDFGVRWEAAVSLARLGDDALPELLTALVDPHRVSDPWLREGAYHVLHYNQGSRLSLPVGDLMKALKGSAAAITTMEEASHLLILLEKQRANRPPAQS